MVKCRKELVRDSNSPLRTVWLMRNRGKVSLPRLTDVAIETRRGQVTGLEGSAGTPWLG